MTEELYQFLACDYYATGEGRTLCLLITRAYPHTDDYETYGSYDQETGEYTPPVMKEGHTAKVRAAREFAEHFGSWYLQGAENLSREEFLQRFGNHLPPYIDNMLNPAPGEGPGNFNLKLQIHMNYS
jgi:hypothetical protein